MKRLAVVVSHPIQHFCPQYSSWAKLPGVELKVFFASDHGLKPYADKNFGRIISWQGLNMDFPHEFLPGAQGRRLGRSIDCQELAMRLADFSPDLLIFYGYSQRLQRRALSWAGRRGIPVGMISDSELRTHRNLVRRTVKGIWLPRLLTSVRIFLTVGDANEAYLRHYGVPDHRLVRNFFPIDRSSFDQAMSQRDSVRKKVRDELSIPDEHTVILNVGKLVPWKRQRDLVDFSNRLKGEGVTVILAGSGRDQESLKIAANTSGPGGVLFAGFVPPEKLVGYYMAADIYGHCSEHEPHSLAISEAIYSGLPVIVSDRCGSYGPTDDVQVGRNGFVYRCGDVGDMLSKSRRLFEDRGLLKEMSQASREMGREHQALAHGQGLIHALRLTGC